MQERQRLAGGGPRSHERRQTPVYLNVYDLLQQGRAREARQMLKRLNLDIEQLTRLGLTQRNLERMNMQFSSMSQSELMDDAELSKYLLASKLEREYDRKRRN